MKGTGLQLGIGLTALAWGLLLRYDAYVVVVVVAIVSRQGQSVQMVVCRTSLYGYWAGRGRAIAVCYIHVASSCPKTVSRTIGMTHMMPEEGDLLPVTVDHSFVSFENLARKATTND